MAEETKEKKNRIPVFARLNEKYGKEDVKKRVADAEESPTGDFYKFIQNEQILIKQPPVAVYSPTRFKFSDDGWGYVGNIQRYEEMATSQETGEPALIYPLGLRESQLWEIIGNIKGTFPQWSADIDENLDILEGIFIDVNINPFDFTKSDGTIEPRKKIRFSIVKDGIGKDAYRNRLEWLKNKVNSTTVQTDQTTHQTTPLEVTTTPNVEPIEKLNIEKLNIEKLNFNK